MRIGINCLGINASYQGGINTYTLGLIRGFANVGSGHKFTLLVQPENHEMFSRFSVYRNFELIVISSTHSLVSKLLQRLALYSGSQRLYKKTNDLVFVDESKILDEHSDIIYTPTTVLRIFSCSKPSLLSMHDIQQFYYPEFFTRRELLTRKILFGLSAQSATCFQASSNFIKEDLLKHFDCITDRQIVVIPEGVDVELFSRGRTTNKILVKYRIPNDYLFCPAQLWKHKNHITILRALRKLRDEYGMLIHLVLTGGEFSAAKEIFEYIRDRDLDNVHYLGKVPFNDIINLYRHARFFITATLYESSSLPILEAAASGTPIIASKTPPNEEMGSILDLNLFDPLDVDNLCHLIYSIWNRDSLIQRQIEHNRHNINYYSWDSAAKKYMEVFSKITQ